MIDHGVTISKAIAIILMVMGHSDCPNFINAYLVMVRMPLFFFMSGYCFKEKYLNDATAYMKRRVTGIYWPYLKWSLVFLMLHNVCVYLHIYNVSSDSSNGQILNLYDAKEMALRAIDVSTKMNRHEQLLGGYWFLKSLFVGSIFFYLTRRVIKSPLVGMLFLLALTFFMSYIDIKIPYFLVDARESFAAFFLMTGHAYRTYGLCFHENSIFVAFSVLLVGIGSVYWLGSIAALGAVAMRQITLDGDKFPYICGWLHLQCADVAFPFNEIGIAAPHHRLWTEYRPFGRFPCYGGLCYQGLVGNLFYCGRVFACGRYISFPST